MDTPSVRRYYEQNTQLFLRFVRTTGTYTIHRALWANGVHTQTEALNYSNALLTQELDQIKPMSEGLRILDLGCGVGGSLFYTLSRLPHSLGIGLTLSGTQARIARQGAHQIKVSDRCAFVEGDFQAVPFATPFDAIYSIEAFAHATYPEKYFYEVARLLEPSGRLILCDDFLADRVLSRSEQRWLGVYQTGWFVPNVNPISHVEELACSHNLRLIGNRHLTPYLRLRTLPDFIASFLRTVGERIPRFHTIVPSMLGSMALQQCLKMGTVEYHFLVFEKQE